MIGQKNNLEIIKKWRLNRAFPRFIIIVGDSNSGRYTLAKEIVKTLNAREYLADNSIESVRQVIKTSYAVPTSTVYIFRDCDDMSIAAKNSVLKIVEEPPNNARFIMTIKDRCNMPDTVLSRATVLTMSPYTLDELNLAESDKPIAYMIKCINDTTESKIDTLQQAVALCDRVIHSIEKKSMLYTLKELNRLKNKSTDEQGVEPELFLRAFRHNIGLSTIPAEVIMLAIPHITKCSQELKRASISKKSSIEVMCVNILEDYKKYGKAKV